MFFDYIKELFSKKEIVNNKTEDSPLAIIDPEVECFDPNKNNYTLFMDDFQQASSLKNLLNTYRQAAENSEIENAIDEICNESIVAEEGKIINIDLDKTEFSAGIQKKIENEFQSILKILKFNTKAYDLFKQWFIEGRLYLYLNLDKKAQGGIISFDILIPENIKKVKNKKTKEIIYYYEKPDEKAYKIDENLIIFVHSGITDPNKKYYLSYLHKSLKPLNQLQLLENSSIIYRITRAPERRVFYIDVGKLSKVKAEAYIQKMITKFRNKIAYDVNTGKITNQKNTMTMLEDFYFPVTEGGRGTKVETLESGQQLTDMQDIFYFKKKLYKSLKIPLSRVDDDNNPIVDIGRIGEITREELKFTKFITRLQQQFNVLIFEMLKRQLIWKNVIEKSDWANNYQEIFIKWNVDSYFATLKRQEIFRSKIELLDITEQYVGKYFSNKYVNKNILKFSDEEIDQIQKEIDEETKSGEIEPPEEVEEE